MTQTPPEPDFPDPNTLVQPGTEPAPPTDEPTPDDSPDEPLRDDAGDIVPDVD